MTIKIIIYTSNWEVVDLACYLILLLQVNGTLNQPEGTK